MSNSLYPIEIQSSARVGNPVRGSYFIVLLCVYKYVLDLSYEHVAYVYEYQNFFWNGRTFWTGLGSWIILGAMLPVIKHFFDDKSASGNVLSLLAIFSIIPTITAIGFRSDYSSAYIFLILLFWVLTYVFWLAIGTIRIHTLERIRSPWLYRISFIVLAASIFVYSYINTGLRFHYNLIEVYDIRAEARDFIAPFPLNYLASLADNTLPVLGIYFLSKRRYIPALLTAFTIFLNFSISGQKQIFFVPLIGVVGFIYVRNYSHSYIFLLSGIILTALCIVEFWIFDTGTLHGLFTYRVLYIPVELHWSYYDYFQRHDFLYYTQTILRAFSDGHEENIQFLIGEYAIGDFTARANNGLFSDAYMNMGWFGVVVHSLGMALYLRILDGAMRNVSGKMIVVVVVYVAFVLVSIPITTAFVTSGLGFLVILLYSLPTDRVQENHAMVDGALSAAR